MDDPNPNREVVCLVMELAPHGELEELLKRTGPLPEGIKSSSSSCCRFVVVRVIVVVVVVVVVAVVPTLVLIVVVVVSPLPSSHNNK